VDDGPQAGQDPAMTENRYRVPVDELESRVRVPVGEQVTEQPLPEQPAQHWAPEPFLDGGVDADGD
jgi:hypothetical protein